MLSTLGERRVQPCNVYIFLLTHFDATTTGVSVCSIHVYITHKYIIYIYVSIAHDDDDSVDYYIFVIRVER